MCIFCLELENTTCTVELRSFFSALLPFNEDSTSTVFKPGQGSGFDSRSLNRSSSDQDSSPGHFTRPEHTCTCLLSIRPWSKLNFSLFCKLMTTHDNLWQLITAHDSLWQLMTAYDSLWQLMTTYDNFWQLLTTFDNFWQLMTTYDNLWQLLTTFDNFWQLLTTFDNFWQLELVRSVNWAAPKTSS